MKENLLILTLCILGLFIMENNMVAEDSFSNKFYKLKLNDVYGKEVNFSEFKDKVVLIVNTASKCGFTGQYKDLEDLHKAYKDKGLVVLGFPSNDFGEQEPLDNEEIVNFCTSKFDVSFTLFEKSHVKKEPKNKLYRLLTEQSPKKFQGKIGWNFVKFLINKNGEIEARYSSMKNPSKLKSTIEGLL